MDVLRQAAILAVLVTVVAWPALRALGQGDRSRWIAGGLGLTAFALVMSTA
ncbi:MAG: hypothetical protein ACK5VI_10955 [Opitutia bacterium]|jgi:hypothetical protein